MDMIQGLEISIFMYWLAINNIISLRNVPAISEEIKESYFYSLKSVTYTEVFTIF